MPPHLGYAGAKNSRNNPNGPEFLKACENNDPTVALQLAPGRELELLTFGLNRAIERKHFDLASQLLKAGAKWDTRTVHLASTSHEAVVWLVESGYDVNTSIAYGTVLLSLVVKLNDEASIRYLLERGANPNLGPSNQVAAPAADMHSISNCGRTLNNVAAYSTPEIFALLLSHGAELSNATPLHHAVGWKHSNRMPMLEYLFSELKLDVNALDDAPTVPEQCRGHDGTPLHYTLRDQRYEAARWLLEHGADPDRKCTFARSPARIWVENLPSDHELAILLRRY